MDIRIIPFFLIVQIFTLQLFSYAQQGESPVTIRPVETDEVLVNPGIGFMTFQRFNGDELNEGAGWTEGFPIDYQSFDGNLKNKDHPQTSIAYFRVYWRFIEPEKQTYRWDMIDRALREAENRGQTLLLRIAPYGTNDETDVPSWYREMVGNSREWGYDNPVNKWMVDPEDPRYMEFFGGMIRELGLKYDGHPSLEAVDVSIVGAWGEGAGSELLSQRTREVLVSAYTDNFCETPLIALLMDEKTNRYAQSKGNVGWRVDCIGDLGFFSDSWNHMYDFYPQAIITYGVEEAWKKAPVSLEICGTFRRWRDQEGYGVEDVKYIFDQTLKWHISSFNAKSSPVPPEWQPLVDEWLKKMGYRFVLRKFSYTGAVQPNGKLTVESWWENKGVAPCYRNFPLVIRLKSEKEAVMFTADADIRDWLPGDIVYNDHFFIPQDMNPGSYDLQLAMVDPLTRKPRIKLAIEGGDEEGWYTLGKILIK
jgi:hypothetical protein